MQEVLAALIIAVIGCIALILLYHSLHEIVVLALLQLALHPLTEHWHLHSVMHQYKRKDRIDGKVLKADDGGDDQR